MRLMDYENNKEYSLKDIKDQNKMTEEDKEVLVEKSSSGYKGIDAIKLYCDCRRPLQEEGIRYQIMKNANGTYYARPYKNNSGASHADYCIKNPKNHEYKKINPLFSEDENGEMTINTKINFSKIAKRTENEIVRKRGIAPTNGDREGIIRSPHELFCNLGELFLHDIMQKGRYVDRINNYCYNPLRADEFRKYFMKENFGITGINASLGEYSIEQNGYAFLYAKVLNINEAPLDWSIIKEDYYIQITVENTDGDTINSKKINIPIWFYRVLKERFTGHYSGRTMEWDSTQYDLILAGSYGKYKGDETLFKGTFIMVSKIYGITSDSVNEAIFYDKVMDIINTDHNYRNVLFYKPCIFLPAGVYSGKFLSDGILESKNDSNKKCIIEVYGSKDEEYLKSRKIKEQWINKHGFDYVYWDVLSNSEDGLLEDVLAKIKNIINKYRE